MPSAGAGRTPASASAARRASPSSGDAIAARRTASRSSVVRAAVTTHRSRVSASTAFTLSGRTEVSTRSESSGRNVRAFPVSAANAGGSARSRNARSSGWYWPAYVTNAPDGSTIRARSVFSLTLSVSVRTPATNSRFTRAPVGVTT